MAGCNRHGVERRLPQAHRQPRLDDLDLRERELSRSADEVSFGYRGIHPAELDEREYIRGIDVV
jgi:hypothetical protein